MLQPSIAALAERAWALPAIAAMLSLGQESAISRDSDVHRVAFDDEGVSVMFEYGLNKYASHLLTARISKCQNIFVMPQESSGDASFAAYLTRHLCDKTRRMEAKIKAWQRKKGSPSIPDWFAWLQGWSQHPWRAFLCVSCEQTEICQKYPKLVGRWRAFPTPGRLR